MEGYFFCSHRSAREAGTRRLHVFCQEAIVVTLDGRIGADWAVRHLYRDNGDAGDNGDGWFSLMMEGQREIFLI